jgi:hypothetical protein
VWHVTELEALRSIDGEHGLAWRAVESRFRYRDRPEVHVVATRVAVLAAPVELPELRRYRGCVSWVELERDVDVSGAVPVVPAEQLARRLDQLRGALGEPERAAGV